MVYEQKNYNSLMGLNGLSETLLKNHLALYEGYVINTNKLLEALNNLLKENITGIEFSELRRRFGWEFNGMRLHEYYFDNLTKETKELDKQSNLFKKLTEDFESYEAWEKEFKTIGLMRGIGWVILCLDVKSNRLINIWVNEHDGGVLAGVIPLIVMDVFEHAYMLDYGIKKTDYIDSFFKLIDWEIINNRFCKEVSKNGKK